MTSPLKPWEAGAAGGHYRAAATAADFSPEILSLPSTRVSALAPALPPRPALSTAGYTSPYGGGFSNNYGGYGSLGTYSGYGGMGMGGYGGMGMGGYGGMGMGGYGGGLGSYGGLGQWGGMYGNAESSFVHLAEESSRPAFQSIQSVVGAVGSVAMMLENTFIAITSSFRAILGVADNFGRLRSLFAQIWSAFAVVKGINWLIRKLLVLMGIRTENEFQAWAEAQAALGGSHTNEHGQGATDSNRSSWPVVLFLGVISAAPYIISRLLGSITNTINTNQASDPSTWQSPLRALAQYDFQATSPQELSFRANQVVTIAPESVQGTLWQSGWLMASVDNKVSGLIPANYVKLFRQNTSAVPQKPKENLQPTPAPVLEGSTTQTSAVPDPSVPADTQQTQTTEARGELLM